MDFPGSNGVLLVHTFEEQKNKKEPLPSITYIAGSQRYSISQCIRRSSSSLRYDCKKRGWVERELYMARDMKRDSYIGIVVQT